LSDIFASNKHFAILLQRVKEVKKSQGVENMKMLKMKYIVISVKNTLLDKIGIFVYNTLSTHQASAERYAQIGGFCFLGGFYAV